MASCWGSCWGLSLPCTIEAAANTSCVDNAATVLLGCCRASPCPSFAVARELYGAGNIKRVVYQPSHDCVAVRRLHWPCAGDTVPVGVVFAWFVYSRLPSFSAPQPRRGPHDSWTGTALTVLPTA